MALSREEKIIQSTQDWMNDWLVAQGYAGLYELKDTYPQELDSPLDLTIVVLTKEASLPVTPHEVGGPLVLEEIKFAFDVLGKTEKLGHNIARQIEDKLKNQDTLPLKDYDDVSAPVIQQLIISTATGTRVRFSDPSPWQRFWYQVTFRVQDEYNVTYL